MTFRLGVRKIPNEVCPADSERAHRLANWCDASGCCTQKLSMLSLKTAHCHTYFQFIFFGLLDQKDFDWLLHLEDHLIADGTWGNVG
jgi:hypothetical protein